MTVFNIGGGAPSAKLREKGDSVHGTITDIRETQQTSFAGVGKPGTPLFWDKEETRPKTQHEVTLDTPDGLRRVYIKGSLHKAFKKLATETAWNGDLQAGMQLSIVRGEKGGGDYGNDVAYQIEVHQAKPAVSSVLSTASEVEEPPF